MFFICYQFGKNSIHILQKKEHIEKCSIQLLDLWSFRTHSAHFLEKFRSFFEQDFALTCQIQHSLRIKCVQMKILI